MHVKYLKNIDYSSILYNCKCHNLQQNNTCDQNKKCKVFI